MSQHLFDTATREVREFQPLQPGKVGIYVCGATVQDAPHIGHLRPAVAFDILRRWLTRNGLEVTLIRNVTDIDDKVLAKAAAAGEEWWARAADVERQFTAAYDALGVIPPTYEPRATGHVPEMIELMGDLVATGHAYTTGPGDVWFDVLSWPGYGELTHQQVANLEPNLEEQVGVVVPDSPGEGNAIEVPAAVVKRSPYDFALWKSPKPGDPASASWETPWGRGRPGWHLECSAMAGRFLGPEFDIHGGGLDLRFPHHENEQAQSRAAARPFARYWLHSAWITQSGEKMSKSLGNGLLAAELLGEADPAVVRYAIAAAHYRSMLEWTPDTLTETSAAWGRITNFVTRAVEILDDDAAKPAESADQGNLAASLQADLAAVDLPPAFVAAMDDDLNVPAALAVVYETVRAGNLALAEATGADNSALERLRDTVLAVRAMLDVLGLDPLDPHWSGSGAGGAAGGSGAATTALAALVEDRLAARAAARQAKDWALADQIRAQLGAIGIEVEDSPSGTRWSLVTDGMP